MTRPYHPRSTHHERLLQCVWYDQIFDADRLQTVQGVPLRVHAPGRWNTQPGPDFIGAALQFGDAAIRTGDVEIHMRPAGWFQHRHHLDPMYAGVILHVALEDDGQTPVFHACAPTHRIEQVPLLPALGRSIDELVCTLDLWAYPYASPAGDRRCQGALHRLPMSDLLELLEAAGMARFERKRRRLVFWSELYGIDGAALRGVYEALGYRRNRTAMLQLFDRVRAWMAPETEPEHAVAVHLAAAGLLPLSIPTSPVAAREARRCWDLWWDRAQRPVPDPLPWRRQGVRPANDPHRRVVAAALLAARPQTLVAFVRERLASVAARPRDRVAPGLLVPDLAHPFWERHWDWDRPALPRPVALVGAERWLAVLGNVLLPAADLAATQEAEPELARIARQTYRRLPAEPSHRAWREALHQLLPGYAAGLPRDLARFCVQQGLLEVFRDHCLEEPQPCRDCHLRRFVEEWCSLELGS